MATGVLLADSIERVAEVIGERPSEHDQVRFSRIEPADAAVQIRAALTLTDMTLDPPVSEDYAALRALAMGGAVAQAR